MWDILWWFLLCLYIPACIGLVIIVLLQKGKGAGFAGAFGIGAGSETVFGPQTAQGTPVKITYAMAAAFMTIALLMSLISGRVGAGVAPDLVDETAISDTGASTTGLEQYGLGTGVTGQVDTSAIAVDGPAEAPVSDIVPGVEPEEAPALEPTETPVTVERSEEPAENEPAVDAPDFSVVEPEPAPAAQ